MIYTPETYGSRVSVDDYDFYLQKRGVTHWRDARSCVASRSISGYGTLSHIVSERGWYRGALPHEQTKSY